MIRKLPLCFFLLGVSAPLVFADSGVAFAISRVIPTETSTETSKNVTSRSTANTVSRATQSRTTTPTVATGRAVETTAVPVAGTTSTDRNVVSRTAVDNSNVVRVGGRVLNLDSDTSVTSRGNSSTVSTGTVSRATAGQSRTSSARDNLTAAVNTVGRNARVQEASANSNPAVRRAGITLRPSTAEVGGRATIAGTDIQTGSNIDEQVSAVKARVGTVTTTATTAVTPTADSIAEATQRMDLTSDLNSSCQKQYNDCMDQFCNVIDSNQGRCSCSANLSNYTRVEEAVKDANNQLNEVAQRIRYVGLSADEIRAIMSETEAEEALSGARDTSEIRDMLTEIEDLIRDPSSSSSYSSNSSLLFGLDMNIDFTTNIADLFSLDFLNLGNTSMSNLRGTDLYNAARNRCKNILNQCESAGANIDQITANYDLAVDRDCIAYEQGLTKMNETLVSNVRSANLMLQKARLAVRQNQNQYDAKGCIAALDSCMTDEMVCGADYTKCLDPTKRYIDENGNVVLGQDITNIIDFMRYYNNTLIDKEFLSNAYGSSVRLTPEYCSEEVTFNPDGSYDKEGGGDGRCIAKYLLQKIGTQEDATAEGLCRPVLDKCQIYTYKDGKYERFNDIVVNYVQRALVNIRAEQSQIISDYASTCMVDVANCYNQQVTQVNAWSSNASVSSIYYVMRGACRNVALTCAYAVFAEDEYSCPENNTDKCIESISEMFYQSLLCPDNSEYDETCVNGGENCINDRCRCLDSYEKYGTYCVFSDNCNGLGTRNSYGTCVCTNGSVSQGGTCICPTGTSKQYDTNGNASCQKIETEEPCPTNSVKDSSCASGGTDCVTSSCRCISPLIASGGSCVQPSGGEEQKDCGMGTWNSASSTCVCIENASIDGADGMCYCDDGYKAAGTEYCMEDEPVITNPEDGCGTLEQWNELTQECECIENAHTNTRGICECDTGYEEKNGVCTRQIQIEPNCGILQEWNSETQECECIENAHTNTRGICECDTGYEEKNGVCTRIIQIEPEPIDCIMGTWNDATKQCDCVANAVVNSEGACECDTGYVASGGQCVAGTGQEKPDCGEVGVWNSVTKQCDCITNAVLNSGGTCECDTGYESKNGVCTRQVQIEPIDCIMGIWNDATNQCDCIENAVVNSYGACECAAGYESKNGICTKVVQIEPNCGTLEQWNELTQECECIENAHTNTRGICECDTGYEEKNGVCTRQIQIEPNCGILQEWNSETQECECVANSYSVGSGICQCNDGYTASAGQCVAGSGDGKPDEDSCGNLGTWNAKEQQCYCVENAVVNDSGVCECDTGYLESSGTCIELTGSGKN